jgi:hypothetical protein
MAFAVIPGVFVAPNPADSHAFVQTLDGKTGSATYHRYPPDAFRFDRQTFDIRVGPNRFSSEGLALEIAAPEREMRGELRFVGVTPWPVTLASPGIMGWYAYAPFMECYHGVLSLDHAVSGELRIDGQTVDFASGRGYIEKDWGQAFPNAYVWMQTNHFAQPGTSLTASVATIPWRGSAFRGFIVGLWHAGTLHRFATYTGAVLERFDATDGRVAFALRSKPRDGLLLEVSARRSEGGVLRSPQREAMLQRVMESLTAEVEVRLTRHGDLVFEGTGRHAGLEVVGDMTELSV